MRLDVPTLTVVVFLNALVMATALTAVGDYKSKPGTRVWVLGAWTQALGWGALIVGHGTQFFGLLFCSAVCFSASFSLAHHSVRTFLGVDTNVRKLWAAPLCLSVLHPLAYFLESPQMRIGVVAMVTFLQSSAIVADIAKQSREATEGWKWFVIITMACTALLSLLKLLELGVDADPTMGSTNTMNLISLVVASICVNLNSLSLLLAQRNHTQRKLEVLATTDALTGLANRGALIAAGEIAFADSTSRGLNLTVVMIDLDFFKSINDTYGHLVGDEVLEKLAQLLRQSVRKPDFVGRFGGEEFCIIMPGSRTEAALSIDRRLRNSLNEVEFSHPALRPNFSAGAVQAVRSDSSFSELLGRADALLYSAKKAGRGKIVVDGPPR